MAYFSNGTEYEIYEETWCWKCLHNNDNCDEPMCPVQEIHFLYQNKVDQDLLNTLIPRKDNGYNDKCAMFIENSGAKIETTELHIVEFEKG